MSINTPIAGARRAGLSLVETMVSLGLASLVFLAVGSISLSSTTNLSSIVNYLELNEQSRIAASIIGRDLRRCGGLTGWSTNSITITDYDGYPIVFTHDPVAQTLSRVKNGVTRTLLEGCTHAQFTMSQRNPVGGAYDVYPAATTNSCKVVRVSWSCRRIMYNGRVNSENMTTGHIVIRAQ